MTVRRTVHCVAGLLPFLSLILPVASDCYWPDGSEAYDQHECYGTEGADGLCCAEGDWCLLNHLCQVNGTTATFYRGACSLPGVTNSTCATICTNSTSGSNLSGEQSVGQCLGSSNEFYCSTDKATGSNCTSFATSVQVYTLSGKSLSQYRRDELSTDTRGEKKQKKTTGCVKEYNTAGSATVITVSPTCSVASAASVTSKERIKPNAGTSSASHAGPGHARV